jgi:hypothetical protein
VAGFDIGGVDLGVLLPEYYVECVSHKLKCFVTCPYQQYVFEVDVSGHSRHQLSHGWKTLHNEELHNLNPSPNIIRVIK